MGGATGDTGRLAYLGEREVEPLRLRLLALAGGAATAAGAAQPQAPPAEQLFTTVPTGRLIASILISDVGIFAELVAVALIVTAVVSPAAAEGLVERRPDLDPRDRHPRLAPFQPGIPADRRRQRRRAAGPLRPDRPERGDDPARPGPGSADGRAAALAAARLVPPRGRRRRATAVEGRGAGAARPPADGAARRLARGRRGAARPARSRTGRAIDSPPPRRARWKSPLRYRMLRVGPDADLRRRRRAGVCAASPAGCRSRRRRASARCRARCSGGFASRPSTSTPPGGASAPRCATGTRPRRRPRLPSSRSSRARPGGAPALAPGWLGRDGVARGRRLRRPRPLGPERVSARRASRSPAGRRPRLGSLSEWQARQRAS